MLQAVEHLPRKHMTLNSKPSSTNKIKYSKNFPVPLPAFVHLPPQEMVTATCFSKLIHGSLDLFSLRWTLLSHKQWQIFRQI
jgi:hypothetical protein